MKAFPLQSLLDLSNVRMDDAARKLGQLLASEQEVEKTLALLEQYREEYEARFRQAAQSGLTREEWSNYQSFLGRLHDAISQVNEMQQGAVGGLDLGALGGLGGGEQGGLFGGEG